MISIIIPTFQDEKAIIPMIKHLKVYGGPDIKEIIVSDGGITDKTIEHAFKAGAKPIINNNNSKASQLNFGASQAKAKVLFFVEVGTFPPPYFSRKLLNKIEQGYITGNFSTRIKTDKSQNKTKQIVLNASVFTFSGSSDHNLFVDRKSFNVIGGYNEKLVIMDDFEIVKKIKYKWDYIFLKNETEVSKNIYNYNLYIKVLIANFLCYSLFKFNCSPTRILKCYQALICVKYKRELILNTDKQIQEIDNYCHKTNLSR